MSEIAPGVQGSAELTVGTHDTAIALGSGDVPVLGTPRLLALFEQATCAALHGLLPPGRTSVGTAVDIRHRRPTPVGSLVTAEARVVSYEGSRVVFEVTARHRTAFGEQVEDIAQGRITRTVVERSAFG